MAEAGKLAQESAALEREFSLSVDAVLAMVTSYGLKIIAATVILIVGWVAAGLVQKAIRRAGGRLHHIDPTIITFASSTAKYLVIVVTLIAVLGSFGVETTSFIAVLGAAGLAIGLALQGTLGHVASGLLLIFFRPFRVGDVIEAGGVTGTVESVTLFVTEIDTADNVHIVVPNGLIWSGTMKNFTANKTRRLELRFQISYADDVETALALIRKIVESDSRVLKSPAPIVGVQTFSDSGILVIAHVWVQRDDLLPTQYGLNQAVKDAFDSEDITMSFPQRKGAPPAPLPGPPAPPL